MIPNQWYAILRCQDVTSKKPVSIKRLGKQLVLFRQEDGALACLDDRCPHKGVLLSLGKLNNDTIACPYHGFQFDHEGKCIHIPAIGRKGKIPKGMCVRSYKVSEEYGYIWLWWGYERDTDLPEIPMFEKFKNYKGFSSRYGWDAPVNYTRYVESVCEVYHVPFVHRGSVLNIWDPKGSMIDDFKFKVEGNLISSDFILRNDDERTAEETLKAPFPWNRGWRIGVDVMMPNLVQIRNDVFDVALVATPIDDDNCWVSVCYQEPKLDLFFPFMKPLPIPIWRQVRPWMMCRMERFIQQAKDMRVIRIQEPKISGMGANKFLELDAVNAHYLKLRERLKKAAEVPNCQSSKLETESTK